MSDIIDEMSTIAEQAWRKSSRPEGWDEYLRKHTLNGQMRELRDTWATLCRVIVRDVARFWLRILDTLGL